MSAHRTYVLKHVMHRLKRLSIIGVAVLAATVGLLLAIGIGSFSFPGVAL